MVGEAIIEVLGSAAFLIALIAIATLAGIILDNLFSHNGLDKSEKSDMFDLYMSNRNKQEDSVCQTKEKKL